MRKYLLSFLVLISFSTVAHSESLKSAKDMFEVLDDAQNKKGVQVGVVVDVQTRGKKVHYEVVTLQRRGKVTAYEAIERASFSKMYVPEYKECPEVMILALRGEGPDEDSAGNTRSWAFFVGQDDQKSWKTSPQGVCKISLSDGDFIGFSRTAWTKNGASYRPESKPGL